MTSKSNTAEMLRSLTVSTPQQAIGVQIVRRLTPSQKTSLMNGNGMMLNADQCEYLINLNLAPLNETEKAVLLIEDKDPVKAALLKSIWQNVQSISPNMQTATVVIQQEMMTEKDVLQVYPFDAPQIQRLIEAIEFMNKLADKAKETPGTSAVHTGFNDDTSQTPLKLKPDQYADESARSKAYALLDPLANCCSAKEIFSRKQKKESAKGWNLYTAKNEDGKSNEEYYLAMLTFKDVWHATQLKQAFAAQTFFNVRESFVDKKPVVVVMFKKNDLENNIASLRDQVDKCIVEFKKGLGIFAKETSRSHRPGR
jgi:hypothetical protein